MGIAFSAHSQTPTSQDSEPPFHISAYVETYYSYDTRRPLDNTKPSFLYSHNRTQEFNVNLAYIRATYTKDKVRANLSIGAGSYMNANYAAEPGVLKNLIEANAGIRLTRKKALWLDAGILPSHLGWESAVSKDCPTLTRSLAAENSPYFESGARLSYSTDNGKWALSILALNGWQRIHKLPGNSLLSYGAQIQYKPNSAILLNYSNFIGSDSPDSTRQMRYFHDLYGTFHLSSHLDITAGFDIGMQQSPRIEDRSRRMLTWYTPVIIARYVLNTQWALAGRVEYFHDPSGVIISTTNPEGAKTGSLSLNIDYAPTPNALLRLEGRTFSGPGKLFTTGPGSPGSTDTFITAAIAISM
jgi:hypothetical protein